jgi:hypothetical protein
MRTYLKVLVLAGFGVSGVGLALSCNKEDDSGSGGSGGISLITEEDADGQDADPVDSECESIAGLPATCDVTQTEKRALEVSILLVMDKSGSMAETPTGYDDDKWVTVRNALSASLSAVEDSISIGLEFFPSSASDDPIPTDRCGDRCCEMPEGADMNVPIGPGAEAVPQVLAALDEAAPAGGTPTSHALERAYRYFDGGAGSGNRYVLLATDGGPNCNSTLDCGIEECTLNLDDSEECPRDGVSCCAGNPTGCLDDDEAIAQIERLESIGVQTIVVGIPGAEVYVNVLEEFAAAGGFIRPDTDETGAYMVEASGGEDALIDTFERITTELVSTCEIPMPENEEGLEIDPDEVHVAINCEILEYDPDLEAATGWHYDVPSDPTTIIIHGEDCDRIKSEGVERLDAVIGCERRVQ